jgi:hypothetical protein
MDAVRPEIFVEVNDDLGITAGAKMVPTLFQFPAKLAKVVDLSVEYDPHAAILIEDGLVPASQINDAKPAHAKAGAISYVYTFLVGSAVNDRLAHPVDDGVIDSRIVTAADNSCNSAHVVLSGDSIQETRFGASNDLGAAPDIGDAIDRCTASAKSTAISCDWEPFRD